MIEVSDPEVWRTELSLDDVRLYLLFLNHKGHKDWRLPTELERMQHPAFSPKLGYWYLSDLDKNSGDFFLDYTVVPVRDC